MENIIREIQPPVHFLQTIEPFSFGFWCCNGPSILIDCSLVCIAELLPGFHCHAQFCLSLFFSLSRQNMLNGLRSLQILQADHEKAVMLTTHYMAVILPPFDPVTVGKAISFLTSNRPWVSLCVAGSIRAAVCKCFSGAVG